MFRLAVITLFALGANASGGGQYGGGSYGGSLGSLSGGSSYGGGLSSYGGGGYGGLGAAIQTARTVELKQPLALQNDYAQPQILEVNPDHVPVQVHFRTSSSRVNVQQSHNPSAPPQVEHASFQDEPHRVVHEVVKPVIQEVREIIQPYRRVTQEIRPVIEEVHTVVHKGEGRGRGGQQLQGGAGLQLKNGGGYGGQLSLNNGYKSGGKAKARA